ncbi:SDR family NAD(P)-dependent oxidoreductase [Acinetobacter beijerinckii]|uniref:SDR family NAD(P)-dependent oxidoreductase n=1 Tax=Acinetobacter beijerinckii TaxID=262668 RepID=UPI0023DD8380|nr:SDR family NAD(P)-dependent oxidoreductase [Acinetobacter beijerinckii]MDF2418961.1 SDR family NAD(P)-dependent oxidoreductase [Acinetobacter beijerinckii]
MKVLITGANTGIGFATAERLIKQGQHVILACRNPQKAQAAQDKLRAFDQGQVDLISLDLNSLENTNKAANEIADRYGNLDVLINNAGLFAKTKQLTADGFEQQFGVNYLGHFLLTQKLLPVLEKSAQARIVHLASIAHWAGSIKPNKFRAEGFYNPLFYYGQSKLANLLLSNALAERFAGTTITNNALHPGGVASDIYRELPKPVYEVMKIGLVPTSVPAKLITEMAIGDHWANRNGEYVSAHMPDWKSVHAKNQQLARDLYAQSMGLVEKYLK